MCIKGDIFPLYDAPCRSCLNAREGDTSLIDIGLIQIDCIHGLHPKSFSFMGESTEEAGLARCSWYLHEEGAW